MLQTGSRFCFTPEPAVALRMAAQPLRQYLDRHFAPELGMGCKVYSFHTARSELANDLTVAYLSSVVHNYDPPSHAVVRRHLSETCNGETETMK